METSPPQAPTTVDAAPSTVTTAPSTASRAPMSGQKRKRNHAKRRRSTNASTSDTPATQSDGATSASAIDVAADQRNDSDSVPKQWSCSACTYLNDVSRRSCEMCDTANPEARASADDDATREWSCVACTMKNPPMRRLCSVCGTINPNPVMPSVLSIARGSLRGGLFLADEDDEDDDDGGELEENEEDDSDGSSDSSSESEGDSVNAECSVCGSMLQPSDKACPSCQAKRAIPRRRLKRSSLSERLQALAQKISKTELRRKKKVKTNEEGEPVVKNAYGVSSEVLKKLAAEPTSSKLIDTLQTLTHTLAMMDASADAEWGDGPAEAPFFMRGLVPVVESTKRKDPELLTVLSDIFRNEPPRYSDEARLFAVQSINYLMKMDAHLFPKEASVNTSNLYLGELRSWCLMSSCASSSARKSLEMVIEECVNGLSGLCGAERDVMRNLLHVKPFEMFIDFVERATEANCGLHNSVVITVLELLQRCCHKLKWQDDIEQGKTATSGYEKEDIVVLDLSITMRLVALLRGVLHHKEAMMRLRATKCFMLLALRAPVDDEIEKQIFRSEIIREFVSLAVNQSCAETVELQRGATTFLYNMLDSRPDTFSVFLRGRIFEDVFAGIPEMVQSSNGALNHALKLVSLMSRLACYCRKWQESCKATNDVNGPVNHITDSPDPNVASRMLLNFIKADSVAAVAVLLKDGADVNFDHLVDGDGNELDQPLQVAAVHSSLAMVRFLVKKGADVRRQSRAGTALHLAVIAGRCDVASLLLGCGSSISDTDKDGRTVIERLNEVEKVDDVAVLSPIRQLLQLHDRVRRRGSIGDGIDGDIDYPRSHYWFLNGGSHYDYDEEDDIDDVDDDDDESDFIEYDDEDDHDHDEDISSEDEDVHVVTNRDGKSSQRKRPRSHSQDSNSASRSGTSARHVDSSTKDKSSKSAADTADLKNQPRVRISVADAVLDDFTGSLVRCLLMCVRKLSPQSLPRCVLVTLAQVVESVPSKTIEYLDESDTACLLDTVAYLLQISSSVSRNTTYGTSNCGHDSSDGDQRSTRSLQQSTFSSYILAIRLLLALVSKSGCESALFFQIERRGISEQIRRFHDRHLDMFIPSTIADRMSRVEAFMEHGNEVLLLLRSKMLQSGMLHLHKLKNLARRLRNLDASTPSNEHDLALVDLVEVFEHEQEITAHEFKQSELLPALVSYVCSSEHRGARLSSLMSAFEGHDNAFQKLIKRLHSVVNREENLPIETTFVGKGRELYPLTRHLRIECTLSETSGEPREHVVSRKLLDVSPLTQFQSFERTIFRNLTVQSDRLNLFYANLVGQVVQKAVDGKWKKYRVCGFDPVRCNHLVLPLNSSSSDPVEMVLHDSQFKLTSLMKVYSDVSIQVEAYGDLAHEVPGTDLKKRKRGFKKDRVGGKIDDERGPAFKKFVEVKNTSKMGIGKLRGAWYAAEIVSPEEGDQEDSGFSRQSGKEVSIDQVHTVRIFSGKIVNEVPAELIRPRGSFPELGSVVEVDGMLGEVTRVHSDGNSCELKVYDVRISRNRDKTQVSWSRLKFPPASRLKRDADVLDFNRGRSICEMSMKTGNVGDRVWVSPIRSSGEESILVSGTIKSFPSSSNRLQDHQVLVEVASRFDKEIAIIKVDQRRVLNLNGDRSISGPARLVAALQMASARSDEGSSRSSLQHFFDPATLLSAGVENLSQVSSAATGFSSIRQLFANRPYSRATNPAHNTTDDADDGQVVSPIDHDARDGDAAQSLLPKSNSTFRFGGSYWTCTLPPRISTTLSLKSCVIHGSSSPPGDAIDLKFSEQSRCVTLRDRTQNEQTIASVDPLSGQIKLTNEATNALKDVFLTMRDSGFAGHRSKKRKNKRGRCTSSSTQNAVEIEKKLWDINVFSAFTKLAFQTSTFEERGEETIDNCVRFSRFALPDTRRQLLDWDGFIACVAEISKDPVRSRCVARFLKSRGYSLVKPTSNQVSSSKSAQETLDASALDDTADVETQETRTFPSDMSIFKCLKILMGSNMPVMTPDIPPWRYKYSLSCGFQVEWLDNTSRSETNSNLSDGSTKECDGTHQGLANALDTAQGCSITDAIVLLRLLHDVAPLSSRDSGVWENEHLSKKLETQLEDAFSICCGTYPAWIDTLVAECKFLFPHELREKFFHATAFGNTRSLHWFRNQFNLDDSATSSGGDVGGFAAGGIYNHEITISPIPKERVKVQREKILSSAEAVMKMHSKRKAILDVVFAGEKGYGSGVTASFYSATAQALQSAVVRDPALRYWLPGLEDPCAEGESSIIRHPNGLFPFPHRDPHRKLIDRFRMMGRLAGKALMDGRIFPLPLSTQFMQLVLGERPSGQYLTSIFSSHGRILSNLKVAALQIQRGKAVAKVYVDGLQLEEWLAAASLSFIDPLSQEALWPGGDDEDVTTANLGEYVDAVERLWLGDGVRAQVNAFRDGISDVLPVQKLKLLNVSELLALLCGDADIDWNVESLLKTMKLAHGYTKDSPSVRFFVEALEDMPVRERREFLLYATGCPNLPAGGFAALRPPFEVVRRIVDSDNVDQSLPFARTCTNTLHLPAYSSLAVLKERLHYAIANSQGVIDRD